jgi:hypothetical protein
MLESKVNLFFIDEFNAKPSHVKSWVRRGEEAHVYVGPPGRTVNCIMAAS